VKISELFCMSLRTVNKWACKVSLCFHVWIILHNLGKFRLLEILIQRDIVTITKWSSFLGRDTHKDSNKIKFVFF
jgi:hypothetical protein